MRPLTLLGHYGRYLQTDTEEFVRKLEQQQQQQQLRPTGLSEEAEMKQQEA